MLVQGNRSGVFMLLSAGGCKFFPAGAEGHLMTQLHGLASAHPILGWWLWGDGVGLLDEALLPPWAVALLCDRNTSGTLSNLPNQDFRSSVLRPTARHVQPSSGSAFLWRNTQNADM